MNRTALGDANEALRIDSMDDKAWYRQSCALEALGRLEEAKAARVKAGLVADGDEISPSLALKTDGSDAKQEQAELDPDLCEVLESFMFIELGVDSIIATDMVMYLKAEFPRIPLPCTLVFEYPTAGDVVAMLLSNISGGNDPFLRRKVTNCVWQAMCASMGRDPLQDIVDSNPRTLSEGVTADILADLLRAYQQEEWLQTTTMLAKRARFELRTFIFNLRPYAREMQKPVLEAHGFAPDDSGMLKLETAIVKASQGSQNLQDLLREVRVALYGGPNGMWTIQMEADDQEKLIDGSSMETRAHFLQKDPFGRCHINTTSTYRRFRVPGKA